MGYPRVNPMFLGSAFVIAAGLVLLAQAFPDEEENMPPEGPPRAPVAIDLPAGYRRVRGDEVTAELSSAAQSVLASHGGAPFGTVVPIDDEYAGLIEEHYHPPGGAARPWGFHHGVSLIVRA